MKKIKTILLFAALAIIPALLFPEAALALYPTARWTYRVKPEVVRDYALPMDEVIVLQGGDHTLHFVNIDTGERYWEFRFYAPVMVYPVDDYTLVAVSDNIIHCMDVKHRRKLWTYRLKKDSYEQLLISPDGNHLAVKYGKNSHEVFDLRQRKYPVGKSQVSDDFKPIEKPAPLVFDPDATGPCKLEIESRAAKCAPAEEGGPSWTFEADTPLAPTAASMAGSKLFLIDTSGTIYNLDPATGKEVDRTKITDFVKMRFWDEKPQNIDNYSGAHLIALGNSLYIVGPSSFTKMQYLRFPESISLENKKRDSTFDWALEKAINAWDQNQYTDAVKGMKEVVEVWPESPTAHLFMGMALSTIGDVNSAINELDTAYKLDPGDPDIIANLAGNCILKIMSLNPETQSAKIIELYEKVKKIQPVNRMAYIGLAELYLGKRNFDSAIEVISESFNYGFFSPDLHLLLLGAYYMSNSKEETLNLANDLTLLFPDYDVPYLIKGKILSKQGLYTDAVAAFEKAPPRPGPDQEMVSLFPRLLSTGHEFFYGNAAGLNGDYDKGIEILEKYLEEIPDPQEVQLIKDFYTQRQKNSSLKPGGETLEALEKFANSSPLELETELDFKMPSQLAISQFQYLAGDEKASLETLKGLTVSGDEDPETLSYIGYLYSLNDYKMDVAGEYVKAALEDNPDDSFFLRNYGVYLTRTEEYDEAKKIFEEGIEKNPKTEMLYFEYGNLLQKMGMKEEAAEMYRREMEMTPDLDVARKALERVTK